MPRCVRLPAHTRSRFDLPFGPCGFSLFLVRPPIQRRNAQSSSRGIVRRGLRCRRRAASAIFHGLVEPPSRTRQRLWGSTLRSFAPAARVRQASSAQLQPTCRFSNIPLPGRFIAGGRPANFLIFIRDGDGTFAAAPGFSRLRAVLPGLGRQALLPWAFPLPGFSAPRSGLPLPVPSAPALGRLLAAGAPAFSDPQRLPVPPLAMLQRIRSLHEVSAPSEMIAPALAKALH